MIEQAFADLTSGPLAHAPSRVFAANAAETDFNAALKRESVAFVKMRAAP